MANARGKATLAAILIVSMLLSACQSAAETYVCDDAIGCLKIAPGEPLKIGVLQALSGGMASSGTDQLRGAELALAERGDTFLDHPIELVVVDSHCTQEGGTIAALKMAADPQIAAAIGPTCSGAAVGASEILSDAGLTMVSGSTTAPGLTSIGGKAGPNWQPGYFRIATNDSIVAESVATFVYHDLGKRKAATIHDGDIYTRQYAQAFEGAFERLGGQVVLQAQVDKGDQDMQPVLQAVTMSGAQVLFSPVFLSEASAIVIQAQAVPGMEDVTLLGGGAWASQRFLDMVGDAGIGVYVAARAEYVYVTEHLVGAYVQRYGSVPSTAMTGLGYDAMNLLMSSLGRVAVQDPDGTLYIGRQALRDALYAVEGYEGITGEYSCNAFGDCSTDLGKIMLLRDPSAGLEGLMHNVVYSGELVGNNE